MKHVTFIFALLLATATMMAEQFTLGKLTFKTLSDTEVELVGADKGITNPDLNSAITDQGKSYSVTSIGWGAFHNCSSLTSITIPNSVTSIGGGAFHGTALYDNPSNWDNSALYIGDCLIRLANGYVGDYNVKENTRLIANDAFYECTGLTTVTIPNSVTSIGDYAFSGCESLTFITIPNSVSSIGVGAFRDCSTLTSITIPKSVTSIGVSAFYGTALYNKKSNWENSVLYISNCLIEAKDDISGAYIIKEGTRLIADGAFWDCESLTSITIPNSVTRIGSNAFPGCSGLTSITIPNSVTGIGHRAFYGCDGLTFITIPNSVTSIGEEAFWDCYKLKSITVPIHTTIGHNAFPDHTEIIRK